MAPAKGTTNAPTTKNFRGSIDGFRAGEHTYHAMVIRLTAQGWLPGAREALPDGLSPAAVPIKGFQLLSFALASGYELLSTIPLPPPPPSFGAR